MAKTKANPMDGDSRNLIRSNRLTHRSRQIKTQQARHDHTRSRHDHIRSRHDHIRSRHDHTRSRYKRATEDGYSSRPEPMKPMTGTREQYPGPHHVMITRITTARSPESIFMWISDHPWMSDHQINVNVRPPVDVRPPVQDDDPMEIRPSQKHLRMTRLPQKRASYR